MPENKNHWYDGWFYDKIIAPHQDKLFRQIKNIIEPRSTVLDVGCGTGRLEFALNDKCNSVLGIDLSKRNIERANMNLLSHPEKNISFQHGDISGIIKTGDAHFDFAVLTYVIHEVNEEDRINLLKEISMVADKIIIGDYPVPKPKGFGGFSSEVIEFIAGAEHYRNYKSYISNGGVNYLAKKAGLKITKEIQGGASTNYIAVLEK